MVNLARVEYLGVSDANTHRAYTLRACAITGGVRNFVLTIPHEAFLSHRVRYQDGPDICYQKVQREMAAAPDGPTQSSISITEADLEEYRTSHARQPPKRRARPTEPTQQGR